MKPLIFVSALLFLFQISCGVKGRPLPPLKPREIGYGKPQYDGAHRDMEKKEEDEKKKEEKE